MSSQQGSSRPPPNLQPKPIAISPIRQPVQNVVGSPLLAPIAARANFTPQSGQQFMVGTVAGTIPRMTAQILQQTPRMAMYVPTQTPGSPLTQTVPKLVTGVPIYQNPIRFQPSTVTPGGAVVRTISSSAVLPAANKPGQLTIVPTGNGQPVIQSPSGQFHQIQASPMVASQLRPTSAGLTNQLALQKANQIQTSQLRFAAGVQLKELRPATSVQPGNNTNQSFQGTSASSVGSSTATVTTSQIVATVTQIPSPRFFTHPTSSPFLNQQTNPTQLSPLVPFSPRMYQVARPVGAQTRVLSPASIQPVFGFDSQKCTIYSHGQPVPTQKVVLVKSAPLNTSSPQIGPQPPVTTVANEIPKDNQNSAENQESSTDQTKPSPPTPQQTVDETEIDKSKSSTDQAKPEAAIVSQAVEEKAIDKENIENNRDTVDNDNIDNIKDTVDDDYIDNNDENVVDKKNDDNDGAVKNNEEEEPKKLKELDKEEVNQKEKEPEGSTHSMEKEVIENGHQIVDNFQNILNLRPINDQDRLRKTEEKPADSGTDKYKYIPSDTDILTGAGKSVDDSYEFPEEPNPYDVNEDEDFIWEEYLKDIGAKAVPHTAFKHVEYSLANGFAKGMKLEVPNKCDKETYWVATVLNTCGPLLRLRYEGYEEDSTGDFWCDLATAEIHAIGWCAENGKNLQPPEEIKTKYEDWKSFLMESLTGARTAPLYLLDKEIGITPIDQLKCGMRLELQDATNPLEVWLVQILENVGGRLFLRLEGTDSASKHFWMFYLNIRLHNVGWGKENGCTYNPPKEIQEEHSPDEWEEILNAAMKESEGSAPPPDVFKDQAELKDHKFEVGMKLEALNPAGHNMVSPATVRKVINNKYFIIEMDDLRPKEERKAVRVCCNTEYLGIYPASWCQCKGIRLVPPPGWNRQDFLWNEYLSFCGAKAAPERLFNTGTDDHEFERGMKLEAVNPAHPNQICAATITKIIGPLLWIHLDNTKDVPSHIEDIDSHNLFPIGWCDSNGVELKPPRKSRLSKGRYHQQLMCSDKLNGEAYRSHTYTHVRSGTNWGSWCPQLFINHRCFSGPYLSKGRIAELPRSVGPGPMGLVLKEVISLLINVAYKSCRVLKELQLDGPPNPRMQRQLLKAKYKGKSYRACVEVCRYDSQLEEFCRNICIKLECCPYLFSVLHVVNNCPENCQQLTKTKYNYNYGKKKKKPIGRPPLTSTSDKGPKLGLKRGRKKKRFHLIHKKSHSHSPYIPKLLREKNTQGVLQNGDTKDEGFIDDEGSWVDDARYLTPSKKRKYTHHIPPPSDIQTRGAKVPKYSFERKTHKKILLSSASPPLKNKPKLKQTSTEQKVDSFYDGRILMPREESLRLDSNPLHWSVDRVVTFIKSTDCSHLARIIKEQEIDGQALLLLSLPVIQEHLELKLGPAVKLCHLIERLKVSFYENYA